MLAVLMDIDIHQYSIPIGCIHYADDIDLISQEVEQAQKLLTSIETEVANIRIQLNVNKTEVMTFNGQH